MKTFIFLLMSVLSLSLCLLSCQGNPPDQEPDPTVVTAEEQVSTDSFYLEDGILIEHTSKPARDTNRYNADNKIFLPNRIFVYGFEYREPGADQAYYFTKADPKMASTKNWKYVLPEEVNNQTVTEFWYVVEEGLGKIGSIKPGFNKTVMRINYASPAGPIPLREWNGLVENDQNLWMYPPRNMAFGQLTMNPYPFVQFPLAVGNSWSWRTEAGLRYSDERWITFDAPQPLAFLYKVTAQEVISTPLGEIECWRIEAGGNCPAGPTSSIFYFHPEYGFVQIEHTTINGGNFQLVLKGIGNAS